MANPSETVVAATVNKLAANLGPTWDSAFNWAARTQPLTDIVAQIGGKVDPVYLNPLIGLAAMGRPQLFEAAPESEKVANGLPAVESV